MGDNAIMVVKRSGCLWKVDGWCTEKRKTAHDVHDYREEYVEYRVEGSPVNKETL